MSILNWKPYSRKVWASKVPVPYALDLVVREQMFFYSFTGAKEKWTRYDKTLLSQTPNSLGWFTHPILFFNLGKVHWGTECPHGNFVPWEVLYWQPCKSKLFWLLLFLWALSVGAMALPWWLVHLGYVECLGNCMPQCIFPVTFMTGTLPEFLQGNSPELVQVKGVKQEHPYLYLIKS